MVITVIFAVVVSVANFELFTVVVSTVNFFVVVVSTVSSLCGGRRCEFCLWCIITSNDVLIDSVTGGTGNPSCPITTERRGVHILE